MPDAPKLKVSLHDVHEVGHLSEDEYSMIELLEFGKDAVDELKFAWRSHYPFMVADIVIIFEEEVRMITTFPELHHQIGQGSFADFTWVVGKLKRSFFRDVIIDKFLPGR